MTISNENPKHQCDAFTRAYIECALRTTIDPADNSNWPVTLDFVGWDIENVPYSLYASMVEDCAQFQRDNAELLIQVGDDEQNGHDFWLTREGHGSGFWGRGYGDVGRLLSEAAKAWGSGSDEFYNYDWSTE